MEGFAHADLMREVEVALSHGRGADHLGALDQALGTAGMSRRDRAVLLYLRSRIHRQALAYRPMLADATAAADLFGADDDALGARAAGLAAIAAAESGDVFVAADLAVRARVSSSGADAVDPWVLNRIGIFCHQMYDIAAALTWWRRGVAVAREVGDSDTEVLLLHNIVEAIYTASRLGDIDAGRVADELAAAERRADWLAAEVDGAPRMPVDGARLLAQIRASQGNHQAAAEALEQARHELGRTSSPLVRAAFDAAEGYCLIVADRPAEALAALDRALLSRPADALDTETLLVRTDRAAALERLGRSREALDEVRRAADILVSRLRRQGRGVLREVDMRAGHELERSRLLRQADTLASDMARDPLTEAGNRRRLETLCHTLAGAQTVGTCVVDLDRFKLVNDRFGHAVGDVVLVETVRALRTCCRAGDDVIRLGGEEFVVVCPDADAEVAAQIGEQIRVTIASREWAGLRPGLRVTASVGTAAGPGSQLSQTIDRADAALLHAKREGRDRTRRAPPVTADPPGNGTRRLDDLPAVG